MASGRPVDLDRSVGLVAAVRDSTPRMGVPTEPGLVGRVRVVERGDRRRLRQPVPLEQRAPRTSPRPRAAPRPAARRRPRRRRTERADVEPLAHPAAAEQRHVHRRHAQEDRHPVPLHDLQRLLRRRTSAAGSGRQPPAMAAFSAAGLAEGVEQRQPAEHHVARRVEEQRLDAGEHVGAEVGVGELGALGACPWCPRCRG